ncbi:uncharacterized protein LAESUDRAFT_741655 [Laetiporus sulphureus 93-53]|uniref:RNA polymerase III RPC4-domain-containing protein n=1 Tax=Laetiporus sulphureus 93-53 TaxID=1314785 RepID=A0A165GA90_9APHY|nr:uncharacterized protein LAESUDRAFT_741655 [Laetiporus sulphureus 93-53]KZT10060.1 hypothetical protein LAESUDRAFT_741655 [Laetiporus sulphureus 93-53]
MSDPFGASGSSNSTPKAIASLAKKQNDVTRMGAQKLKFVPTLPARRKKEEVKKEGAAAATTSLDGGRGRGADRRRGRGRGGEGRGAAPRPPLIEMTASGPFAMGPALAGTSARRTAPRSHFAPAIPLGLCGTAMLGAGLTATTAPTLKREKKEREKSEEDEEAYSDPDEGVEIVDMDKIKDMDWMAPETLGKEKVRKRKGPKMKKEEKEDRKGKGVAKVEPMEVDISSAELEEEQVNLANAVDLSESEDEEELEDIIDDFAFANDTEEAANIRQGRLYFFQFPNPFPKFTSKAPEPSTADQSNLEQPDAKKVSFAPDTKPPATADQPDESTSSQDKQSDVKTEEPKVDGVIGQLEIYESGVVKMRLGNGNLLDVTAATQPSFLQQAVYVDPTNKQLCILGEVSRHFVISPDIETLLTAMELAEQPVTFDLGEDLIAMDTS